MIWFGCLHKFHNSKIEDCDLDSWFTEVKRSQKEYYSKWAFFWKIWIILKRASFLARFVFCQPHSGRVYKIFFLFKKNIHCFNFFQKLYLACLNKFVKNILFKNKFTCFQKNTYNVWSSLYDNDHNFFTPKVMYCNGRTVILKSKFHTYVLHVNFICMYIPTKVQLFLNKIL